MKSGKILLTQGSLMFGLLSVGTLLLAVATDYWLFTQEDLDIMQMMVYEEPDNSSVSLDEIGGSDDAEMIPPPSVMRIWTHSGLWRSCVVYPIEHCE